MTPSCSSAFARTVGVGAPQRAGPEVASADLRGRHDDRRTTSAPRPGHLLIPRGYAATRELVERLHNFPSRLRAASRCA